MSATSSAVVRLKVPAKAEYLVLGRLVLAGIARAEPIGVDALSDLKLALTEACSNSIRHAYGSEPGTIEIDFELEDGRIAVEVSDGGPGFERRAPESGVEVDEGGLGLAIIEAVSDEVEFGKRADGTGSRLRFTRTTSVAGDERSV
jgi:serine/threonine-protein kinase RsbW